MEPSSPQNPSVPAFVGRILNDARGSVRRSLAEWEAAARERPRQALLGAVAVGTMLRSLPVPSFLAAGIRIAWLAAPTALAVIGASALAEYCRRKDAEFQAREFGEKSRTVIEQGGQEGFPETIAPSEGAPPP